jgi:hypothetical protein
MFEIKSLKKFEQKSRKNCRQSFNSIDIAFLFTLKFVKNFQLSFEKKEINKLHET